MASTTNKRQPGKLGNRAAAFQNNNAGVPAAFAYTLKDTQKLGTRKFANKNKYIKKDIEIGDDIVKGDTKLASLRDSIQKRKL